MYIVSGKYKGRKITLHPKHICRPTTSKVREAVFNMIYSKLDLYNNSVNNYSFLDICSGSGSCGIEALSRGFGNVCFVDSSRYAIEGVKKNIETLGELSKCKFIVSDATKLKKNETKIQYNVVFIDPPYEKVLDIGCNVIKLLLYHEWLSENALIFLEMPYCKAKHNLLEKNLSQYENLSPCEIRIDNNIIVLTKLK